ncbi:MULTISPECIES: carbohydrate ABC transporter permease [unclassified Butyrivibrio]|uniref:carbohydrate ABC transporter permease n=1 Tax=unclassified Butyrivibrio TaxID=2639466 RepID=UPI0003F9127D|nr:MULTISPECIES: carbohydrate ABC transporter permease [unclassified Butyrivibrio]
MTKNNRFGMDMMRGLVLTIISITILAPFYVAFCYAFKSRTEFARTKLAFPTSIYLKNFLEAIQVPNYFTAFRNSIIVAAFMVFTVMVVSSTCAYIIVRKKNKFYDAFYYIFQFVILIPFQTLMFPLYRELNAIHALNTLWGLVLTQVGMNVGYVVFLYAGFVKGIPISLEEAAMLDGCNKYQTFFKVVFPLLKPINMTVFVLSFLNSWNDFGMSMIICQKKEVRTIPMMQYTFFGEYSSNVSVAFAGAILAMIPTVVVYFLAQKYIVEGMTAGAVKS